MVREISSSGRFDCSNSALSSDRAWLAAVPPVTARRGGEIARSTNIHMFRLPQHFDRPPGVASRSGAISITGAGPGVELSPPDDTDAALSRDYYCSTHFSTTNERESTRII